MTDAGHHTAATAAAWSDTHPWKESLVAIWASGLLDWSLLSKVRASCTKKHTGSAQTSSKETWLERIQSNIGWCYIVFEIWTHTSQTNNAGCIGYDSNRKRTIGKDQRWTSKNPILKLPILSNSMHQIKTWRIDKRMHIRFGKWNKRWNIYILDWEE